MTVRIPMSVPSSTAASAPVPSSSHLAAKASLISSEEEHQQQKQQPATTSPSIWEGPSSDGHQQQQQPAAASSLSILEGPKLSIKVLDEPKDLCKVFTCSRELLLQHMKYFQSHLSNTVESEDVDISVHCDVHIFEWLFDYIHHPFTPPHLEASNVVSILISSEFLEMTDDLIKACLFFMSRHLHEVLRQPLDFSCLNDKMIGRLAESCVPSLLCTVKEHPKDGKLLEKLYRRRLEIDFVAAAVVGGDKGQEDEDEEEGNGGKGEASSRANTNKKENATKTEQPSKTYFFCCRGCGHVFPREAKSRLRCPVALHTIDFRGRPHQYHHPIEGWSLEQLVMKLKAKGIRWQALYWFLWGLSRGTTCHQCHEYFLLGGFDQCRSHFGAPVFLEGHTQGYYPCCISPVLRFTLYSGPPGCQLHDHVLAGSAKEVGPFTTAMLKHRKAWVLATEYRQIIEEEAKVIVAGWENRERRRIEEGGEDDNGSSSSSSSSSSSGEEEATNDWVRMRTSSNGLARSGSTSVMGSVGRERGIASAANSSTMVRQPMRKKKVKKLKKKKVGGSKGGGTAARRRKQSSTRGSLVKEQASLPKGGDGGGESDEDEEEERMVSGRGRLGLHSKAPSATLRIFQGRISGNTASRRRRIGLGGLTSSISSITTLRTQEGVSLDGESRSRSRSTTPRNRAREEVGTGNGGESQRQNAEEMEAIFRSMPLIGPKAQPLASVDELMPHGHPLQVIPTHLSKGVLQSKHKHLDIMSHDARKAWWYDTLRDQDALRMKHLSRRLMRLRMIEPRSGRNTSKTSSTSTTIGNSNGKENATAQTMVTKAKERSVSSDPLSVTRDSIIASSSFLRPTASTTSSSDIRWKAR